MSLIDLLLLTIPLLGFFLFFSFLFKKHFEFILPFSFSCIIIILYLASLGGYLRPAAVCTTVLGWVFALVFGYLVFRTKQFKLRDFSTPGIVLFVVCGLFGWIRIRRAQLASWDEFSHWGLSIREILTQHKLLDLSSWSAFKDYPPAANLFQYFGAFAMNNTSESAILFSQYLLLTGAMTPFFARLTWKSPGKVIAACLMAFYIPEVLGLGILNILTDTLMGIFFGSAVISYYFFFSKGRSSWALAPLLFVLPLFKAAGLFVALATCIIVGVDLLYQGGLRAGSLKRTLTVTLLLAACPLLANATWKLRVKAEHIQPTFNTERLTLSGSVEAIAGSSRTPAQRHISAAYWNALLTQPMGSVNNRYEHSQKLLSHLSKYLHIERRNVTVADLVLIVSLLFGAVLVFTRTSKIEQERFLLLFISSFSLFTVFLLGHLASYLLLFGEYEATRLASFGRYISIYLCGWVLVSVFLLITFFPTQSQKHPQVFKFARYLPGFFMVFLFVAVSPDLSFLTKDIRRGDRVRPQVQSELDFIHSQVPPEKRMYMIIIGSNGLEQNILRYAFYPIHTNSGSWSFGKRRFSNDIWSEKCSASCLREAFQGYDYVYLANVDRQFWKDYGELFEDIPASKRAFLFKVKKETGSELKLTPFESRLNVSKRRQHMVIEL